MAMIHHNLKTPSLLPFPLTQTQHCPETKLLRFPQWEDLRLNEEIICMAPPGSCWGSGHGQLCLYKLDFNPEHLSEQDVSSP